LAVAVHRTEVWMPSPAKSRRPRNRWSQRVTQKSNALDLEPGVFTWRDPKKIAGSLKHSAESSSRRKASPFQSAMSMLNFYLNRGGGNIPAGRKRTLTRAKEELRRAFGRSK
jgi:uncharacterized protein DUF3175